MTATIKVLENLSNGQKVEPHFVGRDSQGRRLVQFLEGHQPMTADYRVIYPEQDADGNWIDGTECEPYTFE